jgi:glycosyltransferase involved in cell wall biosynthesis
MLVSVLVPVYNEENTILKILNLINLQRKNVNLEILVSNDGSTDGTSKILTQNKHLYDLLVESEKNQGKGNAIKKIFEKTNGEIILIQDADLEYNPQDYLNLIEPIIKNKTKVVYGSRVLGRGSRYKSSNNFISNFRILGNHLLTITSNILNSQNLTDAHTCYKVFKKDIANQLVLEHDDFSFCPEVTTKISNLNEKIIEVPISYYGRSVSDGKKIGIKDFFIAIYTLIKFKLTKRRER